MKNKNFLLAMFVQPETDLNRLKLPLLLVPLRAFDSFLSVKCESLK